MRKIKPKIKLLLLPIALLLSSCGMSGKGYSYGDRSSFSYNPVSGGEIDNHSQYASGRRVFDAFYDYPNYQEQYGYRDSFRVSEFPTLLFEKNNNGGFRTKVGNEVIPSVDSLYAADINNDGRQDLCIGTILGEEKKNYAVFAYDVSNGNKLLELNEPADGGTSRDYALNIKEDLLVIESSYNCSITALDRYGYFEKNSEKQVSVDWKKIQFKINNLEEEINGAYLYYGSDGVQRYIVNTTDTLNESFLYIDFIGDYSTSPYGEDDVVIDSSNSYELIVTSKGVDYLAFSLHFKEEGIFDITFKVGPRRITVCFEANNKLYEMLEVA